jgi:transcriptional regulator GlxA family with amidase domain
MGELANGTGCRADIPAAGCGRTRRHLERHLLGRFGLSPKVRLQSIRLAEAARLLVVMGPLKQVAGEVGCTKALAFLIAFGYLVEKITSVATQKSKGIRDGLVLVCPTVGS